MVGSSPHPAAERALTLAAGAAAAATGYLLGVTAAASVGLRRSRKPYVAAAPRLHFIVLIPAHDEEKALPGTLRSLAALTYPSDLLRVVVIADNCADRTAAVARAHGAEVLERTGDPRGKGAALAWGLAQIPSCDAVLFLDADCTASPNLLAAFERRLRRGARAVQADYVVANPAESWSAALRFAAFALINTVRPAGKHALGLSSGILGTGFAVSRDVLEQHGWQAFSLTEDTEFHLQLLHAGIGVEFVAEAWVSSAMPTSLSASRAQNERWESGKLEMVRRRAPRLVAAGVRRRDVRLLHAALEGLVPPQSALAASGLLLAITGAVLRSRRIAALAVTALAGQIAHVLCGLWLVRAPVSVYRALAFAPALIAWKLTLYLRLLLGRTPKRWERTTR